MRFGILVTCFILVLSACSGWKSAKTGSGTEATVESSYEFKEVKAPTPRAPKTVQAVTPKLNNTTEVRGISYSVVERIGGFAVIKHDAAMNEIEQVNYEAEDTEVLMLSSPRISNITDAGFQVTLKATTRTGVQDMVFHVAVDPIRISKN